MRILSRNNLRLAARRYLAGLIFYGSALLIYTQNNYYQGFVSAETLLLLKTLFATYVIVSLPIQILQDKGSVHKPSLAIKGFYLLVTKTFMSFSYSFLDKKYPKFSLDKQTKTAILFSLVKFFYVPLMLNFFFANYQGFLGYFYSNSQWNMVRLFNFNDLYGFGLSFVFTFDTLFFAFGYLVEHKALNNMVKSVEPTILGWMVALASYPPFNTISTGYFNWYSNDHFSIPDSIFFEIVIKSLILILLGLYLWATLSLGTRCSNLTNRGIVTRGAYKYIRHPAYTGKVLAWALMTIPVFSVWSVFSISVWALIYYLRAVTEERHLSTDPEYLEYVKKTKYRFIPGVV